MIEIDKPRSINYSYIVDDDILSDNFYDESKCDKIKRQLPNCLLISILIPMVVSVIILLCYSGGNGVLHYFGESADEAGFKCIFSIYGLYAILIGIGMVLFVLLILYCIYRIIKKCL